MTKLPVRAAAWVYGWAWLLPANAWADYNAADWQFRRPIQIGGEASIAIVKLDPVIYKGSAARLADLRVLRDRVETSYVLEKLSATASGTELEPRILNKGVVSNAGLELTLDVGAPTAHNRLRLTTPQHNFKQRVRVETSDDGTHWAVARQDGYIFDFSQGDRRVSVLSVDYPVSTRRYVRATIFGWKDLNLVEGALLTRWIERPDTRETYAVFRQPAAVLDPISQSSVYTIDLGFAGLPHDQIALTIAPALFHRAIELETSHDAKEWTYAGQGVIYRTPELQSLEATFGEVWDRYLRFRIINRDDQPLAVTQVAVNTIVRRVKFQTGGPGQYWLAYGNPDGDTPAYDLSFVIPKISEAPLPAVLGPQEGNPAYRPRPPRIKPWSDRHPGILYAVLTAAIAGMAFLTVRFLRKVNAEHTG